MKKTFILTACVIYAGLAAASCSDASIPFMYREVGYDFDLTSAYEYLLQSTPPSPPPTGYLEVNPRGLSIKSSRELSDGSVEIILGGDSVDNGMPDAIHAINFPPDTPFNPSTDTKGTDFVITDNQSQKSPTVPPDPGTPSTLENSIALGTVSKNSKYTVATISGMLNHQNFVQVKEENNSLRLLTQYYIDGYNARSALFNPNRNPMFKDLVYYKDPNFFSENGFSPTEEVYRGRKDQRGGFNVLIWDGAEPKKAVYRISNDDGRTFKKFTVDWSHVKFANAPLIKVEWKNSISGVAVNPSYANGMASPGTFSPGGFMLGQSVRATLSSFYPTTDTYPPTGSIVEGLTPEFTPANATNRNFFFISATDYSFIDNNDPQSFPVPRNGPPYSTKFYLPEGTNEKTAAVVVELADRLRVSAIKGGPTDFDGAGGLTAIVYLCIAINDPTGKQYHLLQITVILP
ncbi:MAG: hypothetical protein LBC77_09265 [Spirochaetaceae bacterium]|jgi:hypothetical protein|nr:hypothetical protein [Spirochaetaceae bacterium]